MTLASDEAREVLLKIQDQGGRNDQGVSMKSLVLLVTLATVLAPGMLAEPRASELTPQQIQQAKAALDAYAVLISQAVDLQNASYRANQEAKVEPAKLSQAQAAQQAFVDKDKEVKAAASAYLKLTAGWCAIADSTAPPRSVLGFDSDGHPRCVRHTPDYWMLLQLRSIAPPARAMPPRP